MVLDTMRQRKSSRQKSHSCVASSTDSEQFDRDNIDCLQMTLSLNTLLSRTIQRIAVLQVDSSTDGHRADDDGQLEKR